MPSIRLMRSFNTYGYNSEVRQFWSNKLAALPTDAPYGETNHTLGKCGLIEALTDHPRAKDAKIIVLRRDLAKQCASYINRHDFSNISLLWQWYLDPQYPNRILKSEPFLKLGQVGCAIWYTLEMECRQVYYQRVYSDRLTFLPIQLETVTREKAASEFLTELGIQQKPVLPKKKNANQISAQSELVEQIAIHIHNLNFNPEAIVDDYIASGRDLDLMQDQRAA